MTATGEPKQPPDRPQDKDQANGPRDTDEPKNAGEPKRPAQPPADEREDNEAIDGSTELGDDLQAVPEVAGRNIYRQNSIRVLGNFYGSSDEAGAPVASADITDTVGLGAQLFVAPPHFDELVDLVKGERLVVLASSSCGNRTAAGMALREAGRHPIVELPAGFGAAQLIDAIEQVCKRQRMTGVVIGSIDSEMLLGFAGFQLRRLRATLSSRDACVVLTTQAPLTLIPGRDEVCIVQGQPPDPELVLRALATACGLGDEHLARALAALELLEQPVAPSTVVALLGAVQAGDQETPEGLVDAVSGRSGGLDEWLAERPTTRRVACLSAAATLDRIPSADVYAEAARLERILDADTEPQSEPKRFGAADGDWAAGIVEIGHDVFWTHFGLQQTEAVHIATPYRRDHIIKYLWERLGGEFRRALLDWLRTMPEHTSDRVRLGAAVTAGVLFVEDPLTTERELLRPWVLDGTAAMCRCAGLALGAPALFGADPVSARALVNRWASSPDLRFRRAAIVAYGGPFGAWDTGSAAPAYLWRIAAETPSLRRQAGVALASLAAGGRDAGQARATVIMMVASQVGKKPTPQRSYELLPVILRRLTGAGPAARESLAALLDDAEESLLKAFAGVLARAFDAPIGYDSACAALGVLIGALAEDRIDRDTVNRFIRETKASAPQGRRGALGAQIERALTAQIRRDGPNSTAARAVHTVFYS